MKSFHEWLQSESMLGRWYQKQLDARNTELAEKDRKHQRDNKLYDMRVWLWNQQHGKVSVPPVRENDPDWVWIKEHLDKEGPIDSKWNPNNDGPWGFGAGVNPGA